MSAVSKDNERADVLASEGVDSPLVWSEPVYSISYGYAHTNIQVSRYSYEWGFQVTALGGGFRGDTFLKTSAVSHSQHVETKRLFSQYTNFSLNENDCYPFIYYNLLQ